MGVGLVNTFLGGDRALTVDDNWAGASQIFAPIVAFMPATRACGCASRTAR
jgi:hypothetical protein